MKRIILLSLFTVAVISSSFIFNSNTQEEKGLTLEQYNEKIANKEKIVLVYFNADWCVPCIKLKPVIEQIETEEKEKAVVLKLNVDDNKDIATHFEINTLPQFYLYRNGKIAWQFTGILTKKELSDKINLYKYQ